MMQIAQVLCGTCNIMPYVRVYLELAPLHHCLHAPPNGMSPSLPHVSFLSGAATIDPWQVRAKYKYARTLVRPESSGSGNKWRAVAACMAHGCANTLVAGLQFWRPVALGIHVSCSG